MKLARRHCELLGSKKIPLRSWPISAQLLEDVAKGAELNWYGPD